MRIPILIFLLLAVGVTTAECTTYYINPYSGVNSFSKFQAQKQYLPWQTIQNGIDSASSGDTLMLEDGVYNENITIQIPVSIVGDAWEICSITGTGIGNVVTIPSGVNGVTLQNVEINGASQNPPRGNAPIGIACGNGVNSLSLLSCAVVNCTKYGLQTTFNPITGNVNDHFLIQSTLFENINSGSGAGVGSCAIWGDHLSHALIQGNAFTASGIGVWISASSLPDTSAGTGNIIQNNNFTKLTQNAIACSGAYNTIIENNMIRNCVELAAPDSLWSASYPGVVAFNGSGSGIVLTQNIIRENQGYLGADEFFMNPSSHLLEGPGYNGVPAVFIAGAFAVTLTNNSIFNNQYGGVFISGSSAQVVLNSNYIYFNGTLNDAGKDYGVAAPSGVSVNAVNNWWGLETGPGYDGNGPGNGVYGSGIAYIPFISQSVFNLTYSPQTIIFNIIHVGLDQDTVFYFYNSGPGPAFTTAPYISGSQKSQFAILQPTATQIIEPGDTLPVEIQFAPSEIGFIQGQAAVQSDSLSPLIGPNLYAFGGLAVLSTADTLAFDTLAPGYCTEKTLQILNIGTETLGVTGAAISGADASQFTVLDSLPLVVPRQGSVLLHIEYCPKSISKKTAQLVLTGNTLPTLTNVQLVGYSATVSRFLASPDTIALGLVELGKVVDTAISVTNTATTSLAIDSIAFLNDINSEFTLLSPSLPVSLPAGARTFLHVQFKPKVRAAKDVTMRAVCSDGTVFTVPISGRAVIVSIVTTPDTLFSGIDVSAGSAGAEQCALIINTGDLPVSVVVAGLVGPSLADYSIDSYKTGSLSPGSVDSICVQYDPQQKGKSSAYLVVQLSNYPIQFDTITLAGTATTTAVNEPAQEIPANASLANYPNPFSDATTILIHHAQAGVINLGIFDMLGNQVAVLSTGIQPTGDYRYEWKTEGMPAGVYYCRGLIDGQFYSRPLVVAR